MQNQNSYSLYHPAYHAFKRRRVYIHSVYDQWHEYLVDMQQYKSENNNFSYILTIIDCFCKYAWYISLKDKTGKEIINASTDLFKIENLRNYKHIKVKNFL
jgi:hypothetical protein